MARTGRFKLDIYAVEFQPMIRRAVCDLTGWFLPFLMDLSQAEWASLGGKLLMESPKLSLKLINHF